MFTLYWNDREEQAATVSDVEHRLDELQEYFAAHAPTLVTVRLANGDNLSIGLGRAVSVLDYVRATGDPPYYESLSGLSSAGEVSFIFGNQWSEYSLGNAVPIATAREAVKHFCESGKLIESITWEEV